MIALPLTYGRLLEVARAMRARDLDEAFAFTDHQDVTQWAKETSFLRGSLYTFADDLGFPIAAGGWVPTGQGMVTWLVATPRIREIGVALHSFAVRMHRQFARRGTARFVTSRLADGDEASAHWLARLGYHVDGFLEVRGRGGHRFERWVRVED